MQFLQQNITQHCRTVLWCRSAIDNMTFITLSNKKEVLAAENVL